MEKSCLRQSINTCFNQDFISHCSAWNRIYGTVFSVITGLNGSGQLRAVCGWVDLPRMTMQTRLPWPSTDASEWHWRSISIFPSFCAVCMEWRQTALGKGEVRCVCVCVVCWLAFQIMKCSREQRAGGPYSLCCSFIFTPVSLWFF